MLSHLRSIAVAAALMAASLSAGCSLLSHRSGAPPDAGTATRIHANPLLHEALASASAVHSRHPLDVLYPPPSPLPEQPSEAKPAGDDVVWAPGYWIWDTKVDNWHWVQGVWVHAPRGRRWVPGYWSIVADGWRWVPGYWTVDPPPAPYAPPPVVASAPSGYWYDDPGLACFGGYGLWWGYFPYPYRHFHPMHRGGESSPAVASPGPHEGGPLPFSLPSLASNIHNTPATPPHLDMAAVLASVPTPLASEFHPPEHFELHTTHPLLALHSGAFEHSERVSSLFSTAHLASGLHEHFNSHGDFAAHSASSEGGHASISHRSEEHGGGHGR